MVVFFFRLLELSHVALFHFTFVIVDDAAEEGFAALDDENGRLWVGEIDFVRFFGNASREQFDDFLGSRFIVFTLRRAVLLEAHFEGFLFSGSGTSFFGKWRGTTSSASFSYSALSAQFSTGMIRQTCSSFAHVPSAASSKMAFARSAGFASVSSGFNATKSAESH